MLWKTQCQDLSRLLASCICSLIMISASAVSATEKIDDPHAHHRQLPGQLDYASSRQHYQIPKLFLIDSNNNKHYLPQLFGRNQPVILSFIFTTCTTICPILTATMSQVQRELGTENQNVQMISISIDPEQDTPEQLKEYADRFDVSPGWLFLTGNLTDVISIQKAFDAYRGDKMNHLPLTYLRISPDVPWVRLKGFASAAEVIAEYRQYQSDVSG